MRCGSCGGEVKDEEIAWTRGTALCPACMKKGLTVQRWFFRFWLLMVLLILAVPILMCAGGVWLFRFFQ